ncbi:MAG: DUF4625 domain-containing protein [Cytophagales bacterium]|nr:DUF4625 domain-containing protein [Cytophagales bacterium]
MKVYLYPALALALLSLLTSCDEDETTDTTKPTIKAVMVEGVNVIGNEFEVHHGEAFELEIEVEDDTELNQLKVDIHDAFDGHGHAHRRLAEGTDTLSFTQVYQLSGKSFKQKVMVSSALDEKYIHGEYHLELVLLDKAGNQSEQVITFELHEEHGGEGEHEHAK